MSATQNNNNPKPSILKQTREDKGLTLEIVHEATKIPMDALKAIEEGYSTRILTPFYYRGFIKIYAEFLGVNLEEAWAQYGINNVPKEPAAVVKPVKPIKAPKVVKPNYVLENIQDALSNLWEPKNLALLGRIILFAVIIFGLFKIGGCVVSKIKNAPKQHKVETLKKVKETKPVVQEEKSEEKPIEEKTNKMPAQVSFGRKVELAVRAPKDSWVQVKTDGKVAFQMTMKKGTIESWSANDQIELSGKNINELELEVNGKHIGPLGSSERRAKRVVITKEGLTVKK